MSQQKAQILVALLALISLVTVVKTAPTVKGGSEACIKAVTGAFSDKKIVDSVNHLLEESQRIFSMTEFRKDAKKSLRPLIEHLKNHVEHCRHEATYKIGDMQKHGVNASQMALLFDNIHTLETVGVTNDEKYDMAVGNVVFVFHTLARGMGAFRHTKSLFF